MSSEKPEELIAKAAKKKKSIFFKQQANEDAAELYQQAANKYKISRQHLEAGKAYENAAKCLIIANSSKFDIASQYLEAAKVYKLVSVEGLLSYSFQELVKLLCRIFAMPRKSHRT